MPERTGYAIAEADLDDYVEETQAEHQTREPDYEALAAAFAKHLSDGKAATGLDSASRAEFSKELTAAFHPGKEPGVFDPPQSMAQWQQIPFDATSPNDDPRSLAAALRWLGRDTLPTDGPIPEFNAVWSDLNRVATATGAAQDMVNSIHASVARDGDYPPDNATTRSQEQYETTVENQITLAILENNPGRISGILGYAGRWNERIATAQEVSDIPDHLWPQRSQNRPESFTPDQPNPVADAAYNLLLHQIVNSGLQDITKEPYEKLESLAQRDGNDFRSTDWQPQQVNLLAIMENHFANKLGMEVALSHNQPGLVLNYDPETLHLTGMSAGGGENHQAHALQGKSADQIAVDPSSRRIAAALLDQLEPQDFDPGAKFEMGGYPIPKDLQEATADIRASRDRLDTIRNPDLRDIAAAFAENFATESRTLNITTQYANGVQRILEADPAIGSATFPNMTGQEVLDLAATNFDNFVERLNLVDPDQTTQFSRFVDTVSRYLDIRSGRSEFPDAAAFTIITEQLLTADYILHAQDQYHDPSKEAAVSDLTQILRDLDPDLADRLEHPTAMKEADPRARELGAALHQAIQGSVQNSDEYKELFRDAAEIQGMTPEEFHNSAAYAEMAIHQAGPIADHLVRELFDSYSMISRFDYATDHQYAVANHLTTELTVALARPGDPAAAAERAGETLLTAVAYSNGVPPETDQERLQLLLTLTGGRSKNEETADETDIIAWRIVEARLGFDDQTTDSADTTQTLAFDTATLSILAAAAKYATTEVVSEPDHPRAIHDKLAAWSAGLEANGAQWQQAMTEQLAQSTDAMTEAGDARLAAARQPENYANPILAAAAAEISDDLQRIERRLAQGQSGDEQVNNTPDTLEQRNQLANILALQALRAADQATAQ